MSVPSSLRGIACINHDNRRQHTLRQVLLRRRFLLRRARDEQSTSAYHCGLAPCHACGALHRCLFGIGCCANAGSGDAIRRWRTRARVRAIREYRRAGVQRTDHDAGVGHVSGDETTLAAVEVPGGGSVTQRWSEVLVGNPITSRSIVTTGPATLIAFRWGDADGSVPHSAVPNNGFAVIDSFLDAGNLVQCAVAVKRVSAAGTCSVTWTSVPAQGAQLWIVAVQ